MQLIDHAIPVFRPFSTNEEAEAVAEVLRSGWWGQGPKTLEFEQRFAEFVGAKHAVSVNSATAALHLSLLLANVKGGEVITTPMTFVSTNHAILYAGGIPVFADIEADTLNIDPECIVKRITPRTRAIMVVDYGGHPANLDAIHEIADSFHLMVIEDAAHAAGSQYKGKPVGSISPLTCFSFHPVKNLATGDGGMITLANDEWDARLRRLRWMGINKDTWVRSRDKDSSQYSWQYDVDEVGFKCHSNDIMSAIALIQLRRLPEMNARRREIARMYDDGLCHLDWLQLPLQIADVLSAQHNYVVRCDDRDALEQWLHARRISTGMHYIPNHLHAVYKPYVRGALPVVEREWTRLLTLPLFPALTDDEVVYIIDCIREFEPMARKAVRLPLVESMYKL